MWHWGDGAMGTGDWIGMVFTMVLVWLPVIVLGFFLLRALAGPSSGHGPERGDGAEEEARRAYARGEIDRERFQQIIQDLRDHSDGRR